MGSDDSEGGDAMMDLDLCKKMERLPKGGMQYYCSACQRFVRVEERRSEFASDGRPIKENADLPLGLLWRETRGLRCGHATVSLYVSNPKNRARFRKTGGY
jgi:hypothetical protein